MSYWRVSHMIDNSLENDSYTIGETRKGEKNLDPASSGPIKGQDLIHFHSRLQAKFKSRAH